MLRSVCDEVLEGSVSGSSRPAYFNCLPSPGNALGGSRSRREGQQWPGQPRPQAPRGLGAQPGTLGLLSLLAVGLSFYPLSTTRGPQPEGPASPRGTDPPCGFQGPSRTASAAQGPFGSIYRPKTSCCSPAPGGPPGPDTEQGAGWCPGRAGSGDPSRAAHREPLLPQLPPAPTFGRPLVEGRPVGSAVRGTGRAALPADAALRAFWSGHPPACAGCTRLCCGPEDVSGWGWTGALGGAWPHAVSQGPAR